VPGKVMVVRVREQLGDLQQRFPTLLGECEIQTTDSADYAYRLFVPKSKWTQVLAALAEETDYDNFKSTVAKHQGRSCSEYVDALHDVWEVMYELQK
jgi:hypothetical protein